MRIKEKFVKDFNPELLISEKQICGLPIYLMDGIYIAELAIQASRIFGLHKIEEIGVGKKGNIFEKYVTYSLGANPCVILLANTEGEKEGDLYHFTTPSLEEDDIIHKTIEGIAGGGEAHLTYFTHPAITIYRPEPQKIDESYDFNILATQIPIPFQGNIHFPRGVYVGYDQYYQLEIIGDDYTEIKKSRRG